MFRYWLRFGIRKGWVSKPFCYTHDGDSYEYYSEEDRQDYDDGGDPCQVVVVVL